MIAYEELCEALARWRSRNGLENGPSARPPQGAVLAPPAVSPAAVSPAAVSAAAAPAGSPGFGAPGFAPATTEETLVAESKTTVAPNPLAQDDEAEAPTGVHAVPFETTNDLDLDNVVLVDEDDV